MSQQPAPKENYLVIVLSVAFVLGMAVAIAVYFAWSRGILASAFQSIPSAVALLFCPPFILSLAIGPTPDADLALVLIVGTIVFANAFLYAGVAAGGYYLATMKKGKRQ